MRSIGKRCISVEVPEGLVEELRMQEVVERRNRSEIIREALRQYLRREQGAREQKVVNE